MISRVVQSTQQILSQVGMHSKMLFQKIMLSRNPGIVVDT